MYYGFVFVKFICLKVLPACYVYIAFNGLHIPVFNKSALFNGWRRLNYSSGCRLRLWLHCQYTLFAVRCISVYNS